jgi:hypothetical protein
MLLLGGASQTGGGSEVVTLGHCTPPASLCLHSNVAPQGALGGTAYDPVNQLFWHSNGASLESSLFWSCDFPCFGQSPVANTSGLAFDASTDSLWILGLLPELVRTSVPRGGTCPQVQSRCSLAAVIPAGTVAAGLALSKKHGVLFYSASAGGNAPFNQVLVAPLSNPCQPLCAIDLGRAFGSPQPDPILGLAFDDATDEIYAVAGRSGILRARIALPGCTVLSSSMCVPPGAYRFHGLCLEPPHPMVIGRSCASAPCRRACAPTTRPWATRRSTSGSAARPRPRSRCRSWGSSAAGRACRACAARSTPTCHGSWCCRPSRCRARRRAAGPDRCPCRCPGTLRCSEPSCASRH